jgi:alkylhydroperoxidase family enzyme
VEVAEESAPIRRLSFGELSPELRTRLQPKVDRLGYLGEFFQVAGRQPDALASFIDFTEAAKSGVSEDLAELVALSAATVLGNAYEKYQHEHLALNVGLSREWVREIERLSGKAPPLTEVQRVVQEYVVVALRNSGHDALPALVDVVNTCGEDVAVAVMLLLARYVGHAVVVNSCGIEPPVESIFESGTSAPAANFIG